jgi:murein DD-endopeptidase MepM/ murein hydrolase activator NlpD
VTIDFGDPVFDAASRITKKTFGLYVTPKNSPVSPERFTGYHSGVDFETTASEQDVDVPVDAVCTGKIVLKKWASGYGGVLAQRCAFDGNEVVVIYGHMKLASVKVSIGDELVRGGKIGVLGKGYSTETDGERKHLHLGIHTGSTITILGYVQKESQLADWIVWPGK